MTCALLDLKLRRQCWMAYVGKEVILIQKCPRNKSKMREGIVRMIERGIYVALVMHSRAAVLQAGVVSNRTMYNDFQNRK